jgi:hypothetical protein
MKWFSFTIRTQMVFEIRRTCKGPFVQNVLNSSISKSVVPSCVTDRCNSSKRCLARKRHRFHNSESHHPGRRVSPHSAVTRSAEFIPRPCCGLQSAVRYFGRAQRRRSFGFPPGGRNPSVGWPSKADPEQDEIMSGECEEHAPPIRSCMIFPCAARAWKPKLR